MDISLSLYNKKILIKKEKSAFYYLLRIIINACDRILQCLLSKWEHWLNATPQSQVKATDFHQFIFLNWLFSSRWMNSLDKALISDKYLIKF